MGPFQYITAAFRSEGDKAGSLSRVWFVPPSGPRCVAWRMTDERTKRQFAATAPKTAFGKLRVQRKAPRAGSGSSLRPQHSIAYIENADIHSIFVGRHGTLRNEAEGGCRCRLVRAALSSSNSQSPCLHQSTASAAGRNRFSATTKWNSRKVYGSKRASSDHGALDLWRSQ